MAESPLIGRGPLLDYGRVVNYQRVCTSQAMDTLTEYTCLGISPVIPRVRGKPDHISSQGKEAIFVTHDIDIEARRDPASRKHSPAKHSGTKHLPSPAHSLKDSTAHKESPASGGPDLRDHSTAHPSGLSNTSDKTEGVFTKGHYPPRPTSDHPPTTPSRLIPHTQLEWLDSRLTPPTKKKA